MAIVDHFLFNSDYPTDKIVYMHEGSVSITPTYPKKDFWYEGLNTKSPVMLYADGDFYFEDEPDVLYPMGEILDNSGRYDMAGEVCSMMIGGECWIRPTFYNIKTTHMSQTLHYRVWCYIRESEAKNTDFGPTANVAKPAVTINSDEEYPKFIGDGFLECGQTYQHQLGYIPNIKKWHYFPNTETFDPVNYGEYITTNYYVPGGDAYFGYPEYDGSSPFYIQVNNNQITTYPGSSTVSGEGNYYRMYQA